MVGSGRFPSLASIRAFEAAARLGSFAKAARELGTSAASVSYHVRQLESQIGVALFRRHSHKVDLTEPGEIVAQEAISAFTALRASFIKAVDADETRLSLTTLPTLGASWLTPKLGRFRAQYPNIVVELELSAIAHDLSVASFDLAIRNGHGRWPGLKTIKLFPSLFMPLCRPDLKEAVRDLADPKRQLDVPLLGRQDWWALWYRSIGASETPAPDRFGTVLSAEHLDIAAALAGHGVAIGSPILFANELASGRLVPAHEAVATDGRTFWLTFPTARQNSKKILRFRDWLRDEVTADLAANRYATAA
jgi:LysR family glycine cleavage system transcriptional activator